ncbi:MAG: hypothetical protein ABSF03_25980, partial [Streptosporangiaceae bacterium]
MSPPDFTLETFQNEYLPVGGREVNAILTVTSAVAADPRTAPADAAEIVIIDCSGSMGGSKIVEAKQATAVALDAIRDGVAFAVVEGTGTAAEV